MQESKWKRCKRLISGEEKPNQTVIPPNDSEIIIDAYKPDQDCANVSDILQTRFAHPPVTPAEEELPIAYAFSIYKGARLFERVLQAIYMPHNVYCIHIDKKSPEVLHRAIQAITRCLPNVFISANSTEVVYAHISIVEAQFFCMEELLKSSIKWKYYISLVGQDFPLYENKQVVKALQRFNKTNRLESYEMPKHLEPRTKYVHKVNVHHVNANTWVAKSPPPIPIRKGSTHIVAIREFVDFVLHSKIGKEFFEFLKDTHVPDETVYASLQQHPLAPGGIPGVQPEYISRALHWDGSPVCHGKWIRNLCWLSIQDLRWALAQEQQNRLFVHKIPFDFNEDLLECILLARQGRKYGTAVWQ